MAQEKPSATDRVRRSLTNKHIEEVAQHVLQRRNGPAETARLRSDWKGFMKAKFRLTPKQRDNLENIPLPQAQMVQGALARALDEEGAIRVSMPDDSRGEGEIVITGGGAMAQVKVPILKCTFDANCGNWKCNWGPLAE